MNAEILKKTIIGKTPRISTGNKVKDAAVLLPLVMKDEAWHILFEVRSAKLRLQPGDICFPGGGIEIGESPDAAACREACEELLIRKEQITLLGEIDGTIGPAGRTMYAYAAVLKDYGNTFSEEEVQEVFLVPLEELLDMTPEKKVFLQTTIYEEEYAYDDIPLNLSDKFTKTEKELLFYHCGNHVIWGATARILHAFLERVRRIPLDGISEEA